MLSLFFVVRPRSQAQAFAFFELEGLRQGTDADLGAGQIREDGHPFAHPRAGAANALDAFGMFRDAAMGKVDSGHIHAGPQHGFEDRHLVGGGADGADDLAFLTR